MAGLPEQLDVVALALAAAADPARALDADELRRVAASASAILLDVWRTLDQRAASSARGKLMSLRAYARSRRARGLPGGSLRSVQKALASKRIMAFDGKIEPERADLEWEQNTNPALQRSGHRRAADRDLFGS